MSTPDTHPTDQALRRAAADLRRQVASDVDTGAALDAVRTSPTPRSGPRLPWLVAAAAALALVVGAAAVIAGRDVPEEVTVERPAPSTTITSPDLAGPAVGGPNDGRDSLDLPVTASPSTDLRPGDTVEVTGEGFNPGEPVGVVQCTMDVVESAAGSAACDLGVLGTGGTPDAEGRVTGSIPVRRIIHLGSGKVDCSAEGVRCAVAIGQVSDYDVSGAAEIAFVDDLPPLVRPTITVSPATDLRHGDTVTVTVDGLTGPLSTVHLCPVEEVTSASGGAELRPYGPDGDGDGSEACWYGLEGNEILPGPDADGRVTVELRVWRAFPPSRATDVVDCAIERCALVAYGGSDLDPEPALLDFDPDGPMPPQAALAVTPSTDLRAGDTVDVTVSGLEPGASFSVAACGDLTGLGSVRDHCPAAVTVGEGTAGADGSWQGVVTLPDPAAYGVDCSEEWACALTVIPGPLDEAGLQIRFLPPDPVAIVYAPS